MLKLVVLLCVVSIAFSEKPGDCPPRYDFAFDCEFDLGKDITCYNDDSCFGETKCCKTDCGGTYCFLPLTELNLTV